MDKDKAGGWRWRHGVISQWGLVCWELSAEQGLGAELFHGGTTGTGVKSKKFGTSKVLLALNKREKKLSLSPRVGTIIPKSFMGLVLVGRKARGAGRCSGACWLRSPSSLVAVCERILSQSSLKKPQVNKIAAEDGLCC